MEGQLSPTPKNTPVMLSKPPDQGGNTASEINDLHTPALPWPLPSQTWLATAGTKHPPLIPAVQSCCYLLVLFLAIQSYFYGSLFKVSTRTHGLHILAIDYDQGLIGSAIQAAYYQLQGPNFLTLEFHPTSDSPSHLGLDSAVCGDHYWGALYVKSGASMRFQSALSGNTSGSYDPSDAVVFIYSGVRYPVIGEAYLTQGMAELTALAIQTIHARDSQQMFNDFRSDNPAAVQALFQPLNIKRVARNPAPQGAVILLNTFTLIIPPLMQFFFVMALDHISMATNTFLKGKPGHVYLARLAGSNLFSFGASLSVTGCIWAFRETWEVTSLQFFETWFVFWFYMAVSYLVMDSFIGTIVPMRFAPFFIFSFVILNVTSTLYPFELSPGFYRWAYALPAHAVWWLLMEIWSDGCVSKLNIALPVMFAWWVAGHCASAFAVWQKCRASRS